MVKFTPSNLSALDGIRCLVSLLVVLVHVQFFIGGFFFPSTSWCMKDIQSTPIAGMLLFKSSLHMSVFWIISGFLCEFSLEKLRDRLGGHVDAMHYVRFIVNRLLRLYPLYMVAVLIRFSASMLRPELDDSIRCLVPNLVDSLLFIPSKNSLNCVDVGWSVAVDFHGYLALILVSVLVQNTAWKKTLLSSLYGLSLIWSTLSIWALDPDLHRRNVVLGMRTMENFSEHERAAFDLLKLEPARLYPEIDFHDPSFQTNREHINDWFHDVYSTSIHKHGAAIFLGSLLYLNLKDRKGKSEFAMLKVAVAVLLLHLTGMQPSFSAVSVYLLIDVVLSMKADQSRVGACVLSFLSHPLWAALSPYTYGLYMSHFIVLVLRSAFIYPDWISKAENGGDPCDCYNIKFILIETVRVTVIALISSYVLNKTIERPFNSARKWLLKSGTGTTARKVKSQ
jgi:peptidoglycan/LPS O-acetylase OafA/YrhL